MISKLKEKLNRKKGFTLAELLIVVAIIGVLVAISIPVFGSQLQKAEFAVDLANVRAKYAEEVATAMMNNSYDDDGNITIASATIEAVKKNANTTVTCGTGKITVALGGNSEDIPVDNNVKFS